MNSARPFSRSIDGIRKGNVPPPSAQVDKSTRETCAVLKLYLVPKLRQLPLGDEGAEKVGILANSATTQGEPEGIAQI
jgi:hypothetical protein